MTEPVAPTLDVDGLVVRFGGVVALDGVTLRIEPGEVVGIIGPNGAGKTTLFNAICGFVRPDSGRINYRGEPLLGTAPHRLARLGIARTLQGLGLWPGLTVQENVVASSRVRPGPTARTVPFWGFSFAVSGRTMPLLVISSRAVGWITTRSPSGRSFVAETVAVANVHSS